MNFAAVTIIARSIEVKDFGVFNYMIIFAGVLSRLADFGFAPIVFRELSKNQNDYGLFNTAFSVRITGIVILIFVALLYNSITGAASEIVLLPLLLLNIVFSTKTNNIRELLEVPFKVNVKIYLASFILILDNLLFLLLVSIISVMKMSVSAYLIAYVVANIPGFIVLIIVLHKKFQVNFQFTFNRATWLFRESYPIFIFILLDIIFQQADVFMLRVLKGNHELGVYSSAVRLIAPLLIIPNAVIHTLFPALSKSIVENSSSTGELNRLVLKILLLFGLFFAFFASFNSYGLVRLIFSEKFVDAADSVAILAWGYAIFYITHFYLNLSVIHGSQKKFLVYSILALVSNLVLNGYLIPLLSGKGAALTKLICFTGGALYLFLSSKEIKLAPLKPFTIGLFMIINLMVSFLLSYLPIYMALTIFPILFLGSILFVKFFNVQELEWIFSSFGSKFHIPAVFYKFGSQT